MSERVRSHHEKQEQHPSHHSEQQEALKKSIEKKAEQSTHEHAENIENIRSAVESEAEAKHEHTAKKNTERKQETEQPTFVNRELKSMAYQRTLRRTQNKLPAPSRALSKVMHQPAIEAVSEVASKTIARPSGVLMGGITAFLGSSIFLWAAKYYGYEYNFLLFALFFIGGFFLGLLVELGLYLAKRRSS